MLMTGDDYRESLRAARPRVFVDGARVDNVAEDPRLAPGVNAIAAAYDAAHAPKTKALLTAADETGRTVARMLHVNRSSEDLLTKLEAVRALCAEVGCAMRYLTQDAFNALHIATRVQDAEGRGAGEAHERFRAYLAEAQAADLTLAVAMTDAKGDRSKRAGAQAILDSYVRVIDRRSDGVVIRGTKAIVTAAPYVHGFLVMPCRTHRREDADFAVACAVPADAEGVTVISRPAGRPGEPSALFSARYGQAVGVVHFDDVFVPHARVFLDGDVEAAGIATTRYATHHRHSCIGARAGFGDLLIGAGAAAIHANGLDPETDAPLRDSMVELIKIVEGFFACGVAASTYSEPELSGCATPDAVFANIGKLLLATQIYDMHRLAHTVSGGLVVALPGPEEDHNPETQAVLSEVLRGRDDVPAERRLQTARFLEDLTASGQGGWYSVISLHGGGSPEAMKREIWRQYPVGDRAAMVDRLLDRGVLDLGFKTSRQPGRCCVEGCRPPAKDGAPGKAS